MDKNELTEKDKKIAIMYLTNTKNMLKTETKAFKRHNLKDYASTTNSEIESIDKVINYLR